MDDNNDSHEILSKNLQIGGISVTTIGTLILLIAFFLPLMQVCNSPVIPVDVVKSSLSKNTISKLANLALSAPFFFTMIIIIPYVLLLSIYTLTRRHWYNLTISITCIIILVSLLIIWFVILLTGSNSGKIFTLFLQFIVLVSPIIVSIVLVIRLSWKSKRPACVLICGSYSFIFFLLLAFNSTKLIGFYFSVTGSFFIMAGSLMEWLAVRHPGR